MPSSSLSPSDPGAVLNSNAVTEQKNRSRDDTKPSSASEHRHKEKVYPERPNRVRAKKPKTRTGCKTCKLRRVKCGEEKPVCFKCIKFGVDCDGYDERNSRSTKTIGKGSKLLPREALQVPFAILPTTALFGNEIEYQYFIHFRDEVSYDLSGALPTKMWNYIIIQATHESTTIRDLTVSIAALNKSRSSPESAASHHSFAIRKYGKALSELRQIIAPSDDRAVRISLIASLLIFCFENIHGDYDQAVSQLKSALKVMQRRLSTVSKPYSRLRTISSIPGFEDDILDIFVRLDNSIMARGPGSGQSDRASTLQIQYFDVEFSIPRRFRDNIDAKNYLEHFQFKAMPYLAHVPDALYYGDDFGYAPPRAAFDELMKYMAQWESAFQPLLEECSKKGGLDFIAAGTIRAIAFATVISTKRIFFGSGGSSNPELFVPESTEMVELCRRVTAERLFKNTFVLDCGIVPALFVAIMICGKRSVREGAIEVLDSCGERMEVTWNAAEVARMGR